MKMLIAGLIALAVPGDGPRQAVETYGAAIARNDPALLARAFHPSAIMYCTDGTAIRATSQAQWKARMRTAAPPTSPVSTEIEWLDMGRSTALARAKAVRGDTVFVDYLLLARLDRGWRIVGKLCEAGARENAAAAAAIDAVVESKLTADRAWDGPMLSQSVDARALVMTVEDGELVAATLAEWQARYADRATAGAPRNPARVTSRQVDARGNIGVARWSFRGSDGSEWTDRALLLRTPSGWRMMALAFAMEPPAE